MMKFLFLITLGLFALVGCSINKKETSKSNENQVEVTQIENSNKAVQVNEVKSIERKENVKLIEEPIFVFSDLRKEIQKASLPPMESKLVQQKMDKESKLQNKSTSAPYIQRGTEEIKLVRLTNTPLIDEKYPDVTDNGRLVAFEAWFKKESGSKFANSIEFLHFDRVIKKNVLVNDTFFNLRPTFIPGQKKISFVSNSWNNEFRVETMSLDAKKGVDLALRKYCKNALGVRYNLKSQALIWYYKEGKQQPSIAFLDEKSVLYPEVASGEDANWTSDNKQILFVTLDGTYQDIYISNPDGSDLVRLTTHLGICSRPSMSPNGQWIVFSAYTSWNKKYDLFLVDRYGNNLCQLTDDKTSDANPVWGQDGWIYFETDRFDSNTEIVKIDPKPLLLKFEKKVSASPFIE